MLTIFMSYASADRATVRGIVSDLESLGHEVWFDQEISGGTKWWDRIVERVQQCDLFIFAVSPHSLESSPCRLEYEYADTLRKRILPILIASTDIALLPRELSAIQLVDYRRADKQASLALGRALYALPEPISAPDPLPLPPDAPISPLAELSDRLDAPSLTIDEQAALVFQLREQMNIPEQRGSVRILLTRFSQRPDIYMAIARDVEQLLRKGGRLGFSRAANDQTKKANDSKLRWAANFARLRAILAGRIQQNQPTYRFDKSRFIVASLVTLLCTEIIFILSRVIGIVINQSSSIPIIDAFNVVFNESRFTYSVAIQLPLFVAALILANEFVAIRFPISNVVLLIVGTILIYISLLDSQSPYILSNLIASTILMSNSMLRPVISRWIRFLFAFIAFLLPSIGIIVDNASFVANFWNALVPAVTIIFISEPLFLRLRRYETTA
ncbi:MAG: toll/interleukin-1 receptor domain-containing protein [Anaerolineae bacterium]|nr:toll/interleukin-1 receptor domain-containing protein [Anaerolineae bacterium]